MPVYYNDKAIIPSPYVSFSKQYQIDNVGKHIGVLWNIVLKGKLSAYKGSPNSTGVFQTGTGQPADENIPELSRLASILRKQEALRKLFAIEGQTLDIQPWDGAAPVTMNPRVKSIDFADGAWYEVCDYTINLEADRVYMNGVVQGEDNLDTYHISQASEEWNIEPADQYARTYRLTHSVQATGKRFYNDSGTLVQDAWQNAKDYVLSQSPLGLQTDKMIAAGVLNLDNFEAYNYMRTQAINEGSGTFQVTETWLCFDSAFTPDGIAPGIPAIEETNVSIRISNEDLLTHVSVEGTITGLEIRDNTSQALVTTRWANALNKWTAVQPYLQQRAETMSGIGMNALPLTKQANSNQANGIITYHYDYNNRPTFFTAGALSESVTVVNHNPTDVFAIIPVLGRAIGPVIQSIQTIKELRRDVVVEIVMPSATLTGTALAPNTNAIVTTLQPVAGQVFKDRDDESWNYRYGRYSRNVSWVYQ